MTKIKISFLASKEANSMRALEKLAMKYGDFNLNEAQLIVALGGDGFMLRT